MARDRYGDQTNRQISETRNRIGRKLMQGSEGGREEQDRSAGGS
jgi:hypothetical protein